MRSGNLTRGIHFHGDTLSFLPNSSSLHQRGERVGMDIILWDSQLIILNNAVDAASEWEWKSSISVKMNSSGQVPTTHPPLILFFSPILQHLDNVINLIRFLRIKISRGTCIKQLPQGPVNTSS